MFKKTLHDEVLQIFKQIPKEFLFDVSKTFSKQKEKVIKELIPREISSLAGSVGSRSSSPVSTKSIQYLEQYEKSFPREKRERSFSKEKSLLKEKKERFSLRERSFSREKKERSPFSREKDYLYVTHKNRFERSRPPTPSTRQQSTHQSSTRQLSTHTSSIYSNHQPLSYETIKSLHPIQKEQQLINNVRSINRTDIINWQNQNISQQSQASLSPYPVSIVSTNRQLVSQSSHHQQQYQQFPTCDETLSNHNIQTQNLFSNQNSSKTNIEETTIIHTIDPYTRIQELENILQTLTKEVNELQAQPNKSQPQPQPQISITRTQLSELRKRSLSPIT
ncbi:hypothetical protein Glove_375g42 [Diversispora epigaea]|uniref:Uncharacterized protein n=1 Tax=Diversispora epigaea TaxID=1348612 RepID=A0A397HCJ4_9GLOM|nr:hypothetical protein Glove_375g42 [Diversispora epigaea]